MMNHRIEGVLVEAKLRRGMFGQHSYDDVTVRRGDGWEVKLSRVSVAAEMRSLMVPGTQGEFHFHEVVGLKGMHGFKSAAGEVKGAFPRLIEDAFGALTMINLVMLATLLSWDGNMRLMPAMMAALGATVWIMFAASRQAIVHDFKFYAGVSKKTRRSGAQRPRHQLV